MKRQLSALGTLFTRIAREEEGGEVLEYALTLGFIVVACLVFVQTVGIKFYNIWDRIDRALAMLQWVGSVIISQMSWEAYRWTAKSPSELFHVLGPHGVDHLVRQALDACWRELPEDRRSLADVKSAARGVFERNTRVWNRIKKPEPAAFFDNLLPKPADQFLRQAMVTCWMMMPRVGGRKVFDVTKIVTAIFERNLAAWDQDNATFTGKKTRPAAKRKVVTSKKSVSKSAPVKGKKPAKRRR